MKPVQVRKRIRKLIRSRAEIKSRLRRINRAIRAIEALKHLD